MRNLPETYEALKELFLETVKVSSENEIKIRNLEEEIDILKKHTELATKLNNAAQESMQKISTEKDALLNMMGVLSQEKRQWESEKAKQQSIIAQQLGNSDGVTEQLQNEIINLKESLKHFLKKAEMEDGNFNRNILLKEIKALY